MKELTLKLSEIAPYENNPRKNAKAVKPAVESIKKYGYQTPIVVDSKKVIITGHTRYLALKELGWEKVDVLMVGLPEDKAREFRIIDNKASELADWDKDRLIAELRLIEGGELDDFFEGNELKTLMKSLDALNKETKITEEDVEATQERLDNHFKNLSENMDKKIKRVVCGHCGTEFSFDLT